MKIIYPQRKRERERERERERRSETERETERETDKEELGSVRDYQPGEPDLQGILLHRQHVFRIFEGQRVHFHFLLH